MGDSRQHEDAVLPVAAAPLDASFVFLGTASMKPSHTRNVSGNALRLGGEWTVIDCGEGTQHQIIRSGVAPGRVVRVFVTHLHGDHCFGLPGLMCLLSNNSHGEADEEVGRVVQIVGPGGLRNMLRASLLASATGTTYRFRVDELWRSDGGARGTSSGGDGDGDGRKSAMTSTAGGFRHFTSAFALPRHPSEMDGLDVLPRNDGTWAVPPHPVPGPAGAAWTVRAAPLRHTIESVGYAFRERPHRGKLDVDAVRPRVLTDENRAFQASRGVKNPLSLLGALQRGEVVDVLEGGRVASLRPDDFVGPLRPGRTIAVLGDTCDSRAMAGLALGADLLVHEATNAAVDEEEDELEVLSKAVSRGHSTPRMAGSFAAACRARRLGLTHFSSRYKGDDSEESRAVMDAIVRQAREALGHDEVFAATDLMEVEIPFKREKSGAPNVVVQSADDSDAVAEAVLRASEAADFYLRQLEGIKGW